MNVFRWLFDGRRGPRGQMIPRWIFLRALALIYFSAFYSLLFQIKGLIGPEGNLACAALSGRNRAAVGTGALLVCAVALLDFVKFHDDDGGHVDRADCVRHCVLESLAAPQLFRLLRLLSFVRWRERDVFSSYQSDGMLLEAGFLALFFAPRGIWPGWGADSPPSRMSWFLLQWEWFRIYFESGMVKLASGDVEWRNFTAMDEYYQNGPLPTWIGWYVEHLPHWFHAATVGGTLALELGLVFMMFFPRRVRLILFFIVTPWEIGVILTANYAFLNYLVLSLGFLLLDDKFLLRFVPARFRPREPERIEARRRRSQDEQPLSILGVGESSLATAISSQATRLARHRALLEACLGFHGGLLAWPLRQSC